MGLGIADVAGRSGVPASTLRYYETIGLLADPPRVSGRRQYDPSVLDRLVVIKTARRAGFTLDEVAELLDGMAAEGSISQPWRTLSRRKRPEIDAQIAELEAMRALLESLTGCDCTTVAECADALRVASQG